MLKAMRQVCWPECIESSYICQTTCIDYYRFYGANKTKVLIAHWSFIVSELLICETLVTFTELMIKLLN